MRYRHYRHSFITCLARFGTLVALVLLLNACTPETSTITIVEEPSPATSTPTPPELPTPLPQPTLGEPGLSASQSAPAQNLDDALLDAVRRGMTPEEVDGVIGYSGAIIGGDGNLVVVRRWTDAAGNSFTARFDEGALRTRSRLRTPTRTSIAATTPPEKNDVPITDVDGRPLAEIAPGVFVPLERAIASANNQPMGIAQGFQAPPQDRVNSTTTKAHDIMTETEQRGPTVAIAGATRREQEGDASRKRAYEPHAHLPDFTRSMPTGRFEIRLLNTTDTTMNVGIRQDKLGVNVEIPAADKSSVFVDKGVYGLSFICDDEPYTRYDAKPITIDGFRATDVEVHLSPEDVDVRLIDYSLPEAPTTE